MAGKYQAYPEYKDCSFPLIKQIPNNWSEQKVKFQLSDCVAGGTPESGNELFWTESGDGTPWVSIADMTRSTLITRTEKDVTDRGIYSKGLKIVPKGSLLYSIFASLGKVSEAGVDLTTNQAILALIQKETLNKAFFRYWLQSMERYLMYYSTSNTQNNLNSEKVGNLPIFIPSHFEQVNIGRFLDHETAKIDTLIDKQQQLIQLLKEKHEATVVHAMVKGLDENTPLKNSGVKWLGSIPEHWEVLTTKRFFSLECHPAPNNNDMELLSVYTDIGVRPRKDLEQKGNKASTTDGYWLVKKGDLIVNKLLAWMGAVGYSNYDGVTSPAYDILRKRRPLNVKFYHYLFRSRIAQSEFKRWSRGIMEMRLRLYFDELGRIPMPFPPENEQDEIVDKIESLETQYAGIIAKAYKQIELLQERRTALISAAVTGKIDVRQHVSRPAGNDTNG